MIKFTTSTKIIFNYENHKNYKIIYYENPNCEFYEILFEKPNVIHLRLIL